MLCKCKVWSADAAELDGLSHSSEMQDCLALKACNRQAAETLVVSLVVVLENTCTSSKTHVLR